METIQYSPTNHILDCKIKVFNSENIAVKHFYFWKKKTFCWTY